MKAISVLQPWAALLVCGAKRIETRPWRTRYRGPLLIHASRRPEGQALVRREPYRAILAEHGIDGSGPLPAGCLLGVVELVDCLWVEAIVHDVDERERGLGDFRTGRWAWMLDRAQCFAAPISWRGQPGIFDVDASSLPLSCLELHECVS